MNKKFKDVGYIAVLRDCDGDMFITDCFNLDNECGHFYQDIDKRGRYTLIPHVYMTWERKVAVKYYNRYNRKRVIAKMMAKYPEART